MADPAGPDSPRARDGLSVDARAGRGVLHGRIAVLGCGVRQMESRREPRPAEGTQAQIPAAGLTTEQMVL